MHPPPKKKKKKSSFSGQQVSQSIGRGIQEYLVLQYKLRKRFENLYINLSLCICRQEYTDIESEDLNFPSIENWRLSSLNRTIEARINLFGPVNNEEAQASCNSTEPRHNQRAEKEASRPFTLQWSICKKARVVKQLWGQKC